ncbi:hypothetical protein AgCh_025246 [Apium graveolens]
MKEVTFKNVKCKTGGLIPRKGDARGMHKGWHFTLNRDSRSFDSMNWKGLREYRRNDSRITLEVLQGESKGQNCSGQLGPKIKDVLRKAKEVADTLKDDVVERKMLGLAVVQRTKGQRIGNRGPSNVKGIPWKGLMRFKKKGKLSLRIVGPFEVLRHIGKLAYELALPPNM